MFRRQIELERLHIHFLKSKDKNTQGSANYITQSEFVLTTAPHL